MLPGGLRAFTANSSCSVSRSVSAASPAGCGMLRGHQISAGLWLSFLHNHREAIAAMDFFSVPTVTFNVLYVFFIIGHDRRRILHVNVTRHPTSAWIVQTEINASYVQGGKFTPDEFAKHQGTK